MENKLTLEHIAPYLPYGVKLIRSSHYRGNTIIVEWGIRNCSDYPVIGYYEGNPHGIMLSEVKPILRPLSDLTKEIEHNSMSIKCEPNKNSVIPSDLIYKHWFYTIREDGHFSYHIGDGTVIGSGYYGVPYDLVKILVQWHFDVFGLIKKGLAIDINTIENA